MALVKPWRREADVASIDVDGLVEAGIRCVLIDRDNTIVPRDTKQAPKSALACLAGALFSLVRGERTFALGPWLVGSFCLVGVTLVLTGLAAC